MYIARKLAILIAVSVSLCFGLFVILPTSADDFDVTLTVSENYKGTSGFTVTVPIYITDLTPYSVTEISFEMVYPDILLFKNLETPDDTLLWGADGYFEESVRKRTVSASFESAVTLQGKSKLVNLVFVVVGEPGSVGEIKINDFSIGQPDISIQVLGSKFQVLPVVYHLADRDVFQIIASEPFSSFAFEVDGHVGFMIQGVGENGWFVSQSANTVSGFSASGDAVTDISIPVGEVDEEFLIFTVSLNGGEKVILRRRETFLPYAIATGE